MSQSSILIDALCSIMEESLDTCRGIRCSSIPHRYLLSCTCQVDPGPGQTISC
jgi:hypothetical protein